MMHLICNSDLCLSQLGSPVWSATPALYQSALSSICKALLIAEWKFASGCLYPVAFLTLELHLPGKALAVLA